MPVRAVPRRARTLLNACWSALTVAVLDPGGHMAEDGVLRRQRIIAFHDEELAAVGVGPGVRHGQHAAFVAGLIQRRVGLDLVVEFTAPRAHAAAAGALGVAALQHEAFDDAVKRHAVIVTVLGKQTKIFHGLRRIFGQKLDFDRAVIGGHHGM